MQIGTRDGRRTESTSKPKSPHEAVSSEVALLLQRGMTQHRAGQLAQAEALYQQVLGLWPRQPDALHLLGLIAHQVGKYAVAIALFDQAIQENPNYEVYYSNRGNTLKALHQCELALQSFDQAIRLKPDYADALFNRGVLLYEMKRYGAALADYDQVLALDPDRADAHNNRGNTLKALQRYREALECFENAARIEPDRADSYNNRGNVLLELKSFQAALDCYAKALEMEPNLAQAHCNQGLALLETKQYQRALESFDKAIVLQPGNKYLRGMRIHMQRHLCFWDEAKLDCSGVEEAVSQGEKAITPFCLLSISGSAALQKRAAEIYVQGTYLPGGSDVVIPSPSPRRKIRVAYISGDFREHPVSYLTAELFERHDRERFEILGFSTGPDSQDEARARIAKAVDRFIDVSAMSDAEVVQLSRSLEVDIAVDLNGLSYGDRTNIFAGRAAPVQVNYLGYPGTMGASFMDYLIADDTLIPESHREYYTEKIVYLPDTFQCNDSTHPISPKSITRADQGLPEDAFVYCCFNNAFKITPRVFDVWMRILGSVGHSVLWLWAGDPKARENLRKEAERRGVSAQRLVFAETLPLAEHLRRQQLADLFLDTLPFNAGATASPALWAGLPILTCMGEAFAGRMAASLLRAVGLPELVTDSESAYEEIAVKIGTHPELARELKERLWSNRLTTPLFDTRTFTKHLEAAYVEMHTRYQAGLSPDHLRVTRDLKARTERSAETQL